MDTTRSSVNYNDLCEILLLGSKSENKITGFIKEKCSLDILSLETNRQIKTFFKNFMKRWRKSGFSRSNFYNQNSSWVKNKLNFENPNYNEKQTTAQGRPPKKFNESSERSKRRKVKDLAVTSEADLIQRTHIYNLKKQDGMEQETKIIKALKSASPDRLSNLVKSLSTPQEIKNFSEDEALALFLDLGLSQRKYNLLRLALKMKNIHVLPSYRKILAAKVQIIPKPTIVSTLSASTPLQSLLDKTAERILMTLDEETIEGLCDTHFVLVSKWGCDGSSGQSVYKQRISAGISDEYMFMASVVPLRIRKDTNVPSSSNDVQDLLLWKNKTPSSKHYCRPILYEYAKESKEKTIEVVSKLKEEIRNLKKFETILNKKKIIIRHELAMTMIDGKVAQTITDTISSSNCIICKAKPSQLLHFDSVKQLDENALEIGISPLHAKIRFMEHILHIAYDLSFGPHGETVRRNEINKEKRAKEKQRIQNEFREELGLIIDTPKQGSGNTNDGNTARRFFQDPDITSKITGVNVNLIRNCKVILAVLASQQEINPDKFHNYAKETMDIYKEHYNWRQMSATVHKILYHGREVIERNILPLGELSEEAQEAKNKDYRHFRLTNTRKTSRLHQNEDLFNMLLLSSDPYITSLRYKWNPPRIEFDENNSESKAILELFQ